MPYVLLTMIPVVAFAQQPFKRNDKADANGTHLVANLDLAPLFLVEVFGTPGEGDGYKVSGSYTFVAEKGGAVFTLYEWKSTNLYDEAEDAPTPKIFWASDKPVEFNIGGIGTDAPAFKDWLLSKHKDWLRSRALKSPK